MKKIVIGPLFVFLVLSLFYFIKEEPESMVAKTGSELLKKDSEIWIYNKDGTYLDTGFLTYNFSSDTDIEWFIQGIIDINGDNSFSYDEWLIRNEKPIINRDTKIEMSFMLPEELKRDDLSEVKVWVAATKREIGLLPDIFEQDGFVIKSPILYKSQESN